MAEKLTRQAASDALPFWRFLLQRMHLMVRAPDVATAFELVARVGVATAPLGRQPDIDVRGDVVHLAVSTCHRSRNVTHNLVLRIRPSRQE